MNVDFDPKTKISTVCDPERFRDLGIDYGLTLPLKNAQILQRGLLLVREMVPTLANKADEVLREVAEDDPRIGLRIIRIHRRVNLKELRRGRLKVMGCDARKVLAILGGFGLAGHLDIGATVVQQLGQGGIPVTAREIGPGSLMISVFDESLEFKAQRPS